MGEMNLAKATETLFQGFYIDGGALTDALLQGELREVVRILCDAIVHSIENPIVLIRKYLITFMLIGIGASLLKQVSHLVENVQIQKTSFWILYLMMAKEVIVLFYVAQDTVKSSLDAILQFGRVFVPTFSAALTLASGRLTGAGYIAVLSLIIYVIDELLLLVILPIVEGYMLLSILGGIWQKDRVEHILVLFEKGIKLAFKGLFMVVTSIGLLQSMVLPFIDHTKVGAAKKIIGFIPGVGKVSETTLEMISGSAILLKNGVGVIGILLLLFVCAAPLLKVGILCLIMKITSVLYGLLGEKELTWCVDKLSCVHMILVKTVGTALLLFVVWILLAVYTTNQRMWS